MTRSPRPRRRWPAALAVPAITLALALGVGLLTPPTARAADRALLIGIDDYQFDALDLPPHSSTRDAHALADLARDHMGFPADGIRVLENQEATHDGILRAIDTWLIQGTRPGDRVMLAYSGHGTHMDDDNNDEADGQDEALVPWDTGLDPATGRPVNLLRDDLLHQRLAMLADRDVLVLVDSCHSGTMTRASTDPDDPDRVITRDAIGLREALMRAGVSMGTNETGGRTRAAGPTTSGADGDGLVPIESMSHARVFSASAAHEVAYVDPRLTPEQGVFTRALIAAVAEGAADSNKNGILSNAEVLMYLRRESQRFCRRTRQCPSLTPTLETASALIGRDFRSGAKASDREQATTDRLAAPPSADLTLSIEPTDTARLGDHVRFHVTSSIDGHLVVLDMNAAGEVVQLYPNMFSRAAGDANTIGAGQTITIPDESYGFVFQAQPPVGQGTLVAIVSSAPLVLDGLLEENNQLGTIADPDAYVDRLAAALLAGGAAPAEGGGASTGTTGKPSSGGGLSWGYTTAAYAIEP